MEATVDINALREGIIRDLKETKSLGLLEWIRGVLDGKMPYGEVSTDEKTEELEPYTVEEIRSWVKQAEDEEAAGIPAMPWDEFMGEMKRKHPALRALDKMKKKKVLRYDRWLRLRLYPPYYPPCRG